LVNCLSNIKSMQNNQVVITKNFSTLMKKNADEKKKNMKVSTNRKSAKKWKYLLNKKKICFPKETNDIRVSLCCKKCVCNFFPNSVLFFESVNSKEYNFYDKKSMISFFGERTNEKKMNYVRIQEEEKNKYERTNVIQMVFSEMRLFVQKIIAFWMSASLVWVLGGCTPKPGAWLCS